MPDAVVDECEAAASRQLGISPDGMTISPLRWAPGMRCQFQAPDGVLTLTRWILLGVHLAVVSFSVWATSRVVGLRVFRALMWSGIALYGLYGTLALIGWGISILFLTCLVGIAIGLAGLKVSSVAPVSVDESLPAA